MRRPIAVLILLVTACSSQTSAGPIGRPIDLRQYLPDALRAGAPSSADSMFRQIIRVGPDSAQVELTWAAFQSGAGRYLASISARLLSPTPYDSLALRDLDNLKNAGSKFVPEESATIRVAWFKKGLTGGKAGIMNFWFSASGKNLVGPAGRL